MVMTPLSYDPEIDGITNSLLSNWGGCRERARLSLHGWTKRGSSFALTYGDLTHWLLQHVYEDHRMGRIMLINGELSPVYVKAKIATLLAIWKKENPIVPEGLLEMVELTMLLNESVMPFYFRHWKKDFTKIEWVGLESEFKIPFEVTRNGITYKTFLRGKRDGVFREGGRLGLFETKSKSRIDEGTLVDLLPFESQVNLYLIALQEEFGEIPRKVIYNVIRRPALRRGKKETLKQFADRLIHDITSRPNLKTGSGNSCTGGKGKPPTGGIATPARASTGSAGCCPSAPARITPRTSCGPSSSTNWETTYDDSVRHSGWRDHRPVGGCPPPRLASL